MHITVWSVSVDCVMFLYVFPYIANASVSCEQLQSPDSLLIVVLMLAHLVSVLRDCSFNPNIAVYSPFSLSSSSLPLFPCASVCPPQIMS